MTDLFNCSDDSFFELSPSSRVCAADPADQGHCIFSCLLTDLDNTLYDFAAAQEAACRAVIRIAGIGNCNGLIRSFLFSPHGVTNTIPIREYLQDLGIYDEDHITRACIEYDIVKNQNIVAFPGVVETLHHIHRTGIVIGAITNASHSQAIERLKLIGVRDLFSVIVSPDVSGFKKPDPAIFLYAADQMQMPGENICMIGDNLMNDISPAQFLGMYSVYAKYGDRLPPEFAGDAVPDVVIDCFSELIPVLGIR